MFHKGFYSIIAFFCLLAMLGFDFSKHSISIQEIQDGGPPKDAIPALYDPEFVSGDEAKYLNPQDRVLGIMINGEAKAYPISILNWHEIVNDRIGGKDILVSYCPLCGTGMVFDARIKGNRVLFGVSGKLYNSDVLMYDKQTESLWSQIQMEAVTGPMTGEKLTLLPVQHTTWDAWRSKYPDTLVLSNKTGYSRDYSRNPYSGYGQSSEIYFPINHRDNRLPVKEWIVGIVIDGQAKAYSFGLLKKERAAVKDVIGNKEITVYLDKKNESAVVKDINGNVIPSVQAYWFAWRAFYPQTGIFKGDEVEAAVGRQDFGLKVGTTAPDFTTSTDKGNKVTLSGLYKKGPVVLIFYSGGWCPVCSLYLKTLQRHQPDFKKAGIRLLAISGDRPEYSRRLVEKDGLGFDVISDPQEKILKAYNVQYAVPQSLAREYIERYHIDKKAYMDRKHFAIAVPAEYVIDRTGKIIYAKADFKVRVKPKEIFGLARSLK